MLSENAIRVLQARYLRHGSDGRITETPAAGISRRVYHPPYPQPTRDHRAMKTDLSDEEVKLIVEALEHYYAYTRATQRDDSLYQELANKLKKKR